MADTTNPSEENLVDTAPKGLALDDAAVEQARTEGAKEDVQAIAKEVHRFMTDGQEPGVPLNMRWHGSEEIQQYAFWLDRPLADLKKAYEDGNIPDEKLYGLLALERNGKNRTDHVTYMVDTLKLKNDQPDGVPLATVLPGGGPSYTNDKSAITEL